MAPPIGSGKIAKLWKKTVPGAAASPTSYDAAALPIRLKAAHAAIARPTAETSVWMTSTDAVALRERRRQQHRYPVAWTE